MGVVPVSSQISEGRWELFSQSVDKTLDVFLIVTDANYSSLREEFVPAERMFETHIILSGPTTVGAVKSGDLLTFGFDRPALVLCNSGSGAGYTVSCEPGPRQMVSLYCRCEYLKALFLLEGDTLNVRADSLLNANSDDFRLLEIGLSSEIQDICQSLLDVSLMGRPRALFFFAQCLRLICAVFHELTRLGPESASYTLKAKDVAALEQARVILAQNFRSPPSISLLSKRVGLNTDKLKRGFKLLFGVTPGEYSLRHRMTVGRRLIEETELSIKEVATAAGYSHHASFATAFKAAYGVQPSTIRRRFIKDVEGIHVPPNA